MDGWPYGDHTTYKIIFLYVWSFWKYSIHPCLPMISQHCDILPIENTCLVCLKIGYVWIHTV